MNGVTAEQVSQLAEPFAPENVHWRAQSVTKKEPFKAMALAYIDARDVMDRLDAICGPENWQDEYEETPKGRILCTLTIRIDEHWISKSDGAGETDVEGDKGALSDALKRAAVKWGIARYLYSMPNVWVPCEVDQNGKFRKFTEDPWKHVKGYTPPKPKADPTPKKTVGPVPAEVQDLLDDIGCRDTQESLRNLWEATGEAASKGPHGDAVKSAFGKRKAAIELLDSVN